MHEVPAVLRGTLKHPKHEPLLEGAAERIHAAVRELKELGIVDEKGNRVRTDLPEDMKEGVVSSSRMLKKTTQPPMNTDKTNSNSLFSICVHRCLSVASFVFGFFQHPAGRAPRAAAGDRVWDPEIAGDLSGGTSKAFGSDENG
jgi:hypothetical protein